MLAFQQISIQKLHYYCARSSPCAKMNKTMYGINTNKFSLALDYLYIQCKATPFFYIELRVPFSPIKHTQLDQHAGAISPASKKKFEIEASYCINPLFCVFDERLVFIPYWFYDRSLWRTARRFSVPERKGVYIGCGDLLQIRQPEIINSWLSERESNSSIVTSSHRKAKGKGCIL